MSDGGPAGVGSGYQSLYRRFRPQRFAEVRGQPHVTAALTNAVREGRVSHAYLFSGPRGTGKTSTARILAKALNCADPVGGEPCGACPSCRAVQAGASLDVHELDAASNNGVDAMRDLVARAALATPGRWKVYIVDEVHMLSTAASNTLLKTLEEPPPHVSFVLATTDPQKVLPTVVSRAQHYQFRLLGAGELASLVAEVNQAAGLGLPGAALEAVARQGRGSARDALSALDQAAAAGGESPADEAGAAVDELVEAVCGRDAPAALRAVERASAAGRDARRLASDAVEELRQVLLASLAPDLGDGAAERHEQRAELARQAGPAGLLRAIESLGQALVDMRDAPEPRVTLEVAVVRVSHPEADVSRAAVLERLERLERAAARPTAVAPPDPPAPPPSPSPSPPPTRTGPAGPARAALGALRRPAAAPAADPPADPPAAAPEPEPAPTAAPSRDELTKAWGDGVLAALPGRARSRYGSGRFVPSEGGHAVFAIPSEHWLERCREVRHEVEAALAAHFGRPVPLRLAVEGAGPAPGTAPSPHPDDDPHPDPDEEPVPWDEAPPAVASPEERLKQAFPGAEEVE